MGFDLWDVLNVPKLEQQLFFKMGFVYYMHQVLSAVPKQTAIVLTREEKGWIYFGVS